MPEYEQYARAFRDLLGTSLRAKLDLLPEKQYPRGQVPASPREVEHRLAGAVIAGPSGWLYLPQDAGPNGSPSWQPIVDGTVLATAARHGGLRILIRAERDDVGRYRWVRLIRPEPATGIFEGLWRRVTSNDTPTKSTDREWSEPLAELSQWPHVQDTTIETETPPFDWTEQRTTNWDRWSVVNTGQVGRSEREKRARFPDKLTISTDRQGLLQESEEYREFCRNSAREQSRLDDAVKAVAASLNGCEKWALAIQRNLPSGDNTVTAHERDSWKRIIPSPIGRIVLLQQMIYRWAGVLDDEAKRRGAVGIFVNWWMKQFFVDRGPLKLADVIRIPDVTHPNAGVVAVVQTHIVKNIVTSQGLISDAGLNEMRDTPKTILERRCSEVIVELWSALDRADARGAPPDYNDYREILERQLSSVATTENLTR